MFFTCFFLSAIISLSIGEECSETEAERCIANSECELLDGFPSCLCKAGFSGSADAETEGVCAPDKNEVKIAFRDISTAIPWHSDLLDRNSPKYREMSGRIVHTMTEIDGAVYIWGPWTLKNIQVDFERGVDEKTMAAITILYGVQEEDTSEFETLVSDSVARSVMDTIINQQSVFGGENTLDGLEASVSSCGKAGKCPSCECWEEVNGKCKIRVNAAGNPLCAKVTCLHDRLFVAFDNTLFERDNVRNPWSNGNGVSVPQWDTELGKWTLDCKIGECNMQTAQSVQDGKEIYTFKVIAKYLGDTMVVRDDLRLNFGDLKSRFGISCDYEANVEVQSSKLALKSVEHHATLRSRGSFANGFSLKLYSDPDFKYEISEAFLGSRIYARIEWSIESDLTFILTDCEIQTAKIIEHTCFSRALWVKSLNENQQKIVKSKTEFSMVAFTMVNQMSASSLTEATLTCNLKVCLTQDSCNNLEQCVSSPYMYSPLGY